jgi:hypothetical protein
VSDRLGADISTRAIANAVVGQPVSRDSVGPWLLAVDSISEADGGGAIVVCFDHEIARKCAATQQVGPRCPGQFVAVLDAD